MFRFMTRRQVLLAIIVQSVVALFAAVSLGGDPPRPAPTNDQIMRALNQTTALEAREAPIRGVAEYFAMTHAIPINVDKGVGDVAITIKIDGVKLRDALNLILGPNGLEYVVVSGTVLIRAKK